MTPKTIAVLLTIAVAAGARAGDAPQGVLTRAPAVVEPVVPDYPERAKALGITGEVVLELDVSADGRVLDVRVLTPAPAATAIVSRTAMVFGVMASSLVTRGGRCR